MALIHCPECNREISDKVKACPFCGFPFKSNLDTESAVQQVDEASVNIVLKDPLKMKKILIGAIVTIVILAIGFTAFTVVKNENEKKEFNTYIDNLDLVRSTMINGGSEAETLLNLTARVWHNSIWEISDPETDKYTRSSGSGFNDDFNISLGVFMNDRPILASISRIKANQDSVERIMKDLQNPPEGLERSYDTITELYPAYKSLTDLAISPSGSLQTFNQNRSQRIDRFLELFQKLETQIPEKK